MKEDTEKILSANKINTNIKWPLNNLKIKLLVVKCLLHLVTNYDQLSYQKATKF